MNLSAGWCRDCISPIADGDPACPRCHSRRIVRHREGHTLSIAHVDCDAFYAAVEKRDDPSLADKPVIVGGGVRGVVTTCCYIARASGVRSAMPMFKATKLCPSAVIIKPNMAKYAVEGKRVRAMMQNLTPLVEPLSIDEAFLDLSGTDALHGGPPMRTLVAFQKQVEAEIGITVSIGLAPNKFLAKTASELDKPRGFAVITQAEGAALLAPKPVTAIWGVGPAMAQALAKDGYRTVGDLARADLAQLARKHGDNGLRLARLANGVDSRRVDPESERKSISAETTFNTDIADPERLVDELWGMCARVGDRARATATAGRVVVLKLKTGDFKTVTRRIILPAPTQTARVLFEHARRLLAAETKGQSYRLIGVGIAEFSDGTGADAGDLMDTHTPKAAAAERAMDAARAKFGMASVVSGRDLKRLR